MKTLIRFIVVIPLFMLSLAAQAERADSSKPVGLEADRVSVDEKQKIQIFEGNVRLTQGSMIISTSKLLVRQDADGFQSGTASGGTAANEGLARFKQKREGRNDYIEGEAERIEHDNKTEKTEFFGRARVKSGLDEVRGSYISYDGKTENYVVSGDGGKGGRVTATIQPRDKTKPESAAKP